MSALATKGVPGVFLPQLPALEFCIGLLGRVQLVHVGESEPRPSCLCLEHLAQGPIFSASIPCFLFKLECDGYKPCMLALTFNPSGSTWEVEAVNLCEFKASLVYLASSRLARTR